jgi:hypothetical protein
MKEKAVQSEAGNITVLSYAKDLLIWVDGVGYIVADPKHSDKAISIDYSSKETLEQIKAKVDAAFQKAKDERYANGQ